MPTVEILIALKIEEETKNFILFITFWFKAKLFNLNSPVFEC